MVINRFSVSCPLELHVNFLDVSKFDFGEENLIQYFIEHDFDGIDSNNHSLHIRNLVQS